MRLVLNVGGKKFVTTLETIASCPDSMLYKLCQPNGEFAEASDGTINIDRVRYTK
jgi:hypothetical protein